MAKYYVEFVQRSYGSLEKARAKAYRMVMEEGYSAVPIYDADERPIGSVEYWKPGYKPKWRKWGNKNASHTVELSGSITRL